MKHLSRHLSSRQIQSKMIINIPDGTWSSRVGNIVAQFHISFLWSWGGDLQKWEEEKGFLEFGSVPINGDTRTLC